MVPSGNTAVLYGSVQHNALQLEAVSRTLVQCVATCDLLAVTLVYSTMLVTLLYRSWVLGPLLCFITGRAAYLIVMNEVWLILALSLYRAWRLKQPRGRVLDRRVLWLMAVVFLLLSIALTVLSMVKSPVVYFPQNLTCLTGDLFTK